MWNRIFREVSQDNLVSKSSWLPVQNKLNVPRENACCSEATSQVRTWGLQDHRSQGAWLLNGCAKPPGNQTCSTENCGILVPCHLCFHSLLHFFFERTFLSVHAIRKECSLRCFPCRTGGPNADFWTLRRDRNSDQEVWALPGKDQRAHRGSDGSQELTEF